MSQTVNSPGLSGMNRASLEATGPPEGGPPMPNDRNKNIISGKFIIYKTLRPASIIHQRYLASFYTSFPVFIEDFNRLCHGDHF